MHGSRDYLGPLTSLCRVNLEISKTAHEVTNLKDGGVTNLTSEMKRYTVLVLLRDCRANKVVSR